jgi:hypothetical protein
MTKFDSLSKSDNSQKLAASLFKAMNRTLAVSFVLFAAWICIEIMMDLEVDFIAKMLFVLLFISLISTLCAAVVGMTLGGGNIFSIPLWLLCRILGSDLQQLRGIQLSKIMIPGMFFCLTLAVSLAIAWKLPDVSSQVMVVSTVVYQLSTFAMWWRLMKV